MPTTYDHALGLLHRVATPHGFLASAEATTNYQRVWARDGVICGLAALASGDAKLIATFRATLETLAAHQHPIGTIPSNVLVTAHGTEVSYGGLAGRVDAVTWFVIGVTQYARYTHDPAFVQAHQPQLQKCLDLLNAWEFNNRHLLYVPLSGNWADEYITHGYVLYDQLLRLWALQSYQEFANDGLLATKIEAIQGQLRLNFLPGNSSGLYHERAYRQHQFGPFLPCAFSPAGYKPQFDALANALAVLLQLTPEAEATALCDHAHSLAASTLLGLVPAFWPPVFEGDEDWPLLRENCKYEFRNYPYEFHNGGSWPMVNGFFGLALSATGQRDEALQLLDGLNRANALADYSFYENFNTATGAPNGVAYCAWSAAATVLLHQNLYHGFNCFP